MALVAWRVFSQQFARMLALEKAIRKGEDIEALHDMRVAVRRMRSAARVFEDYLDSRKLEPQINGLRKTLRALGDVRDLDFFREKAEEYIKKFSLRMNVILIHYLKCLLKKREKLGKTCLPIWTAKNTPVSRKISWTFFLSLKPGLNLPQPESMMLCHIELEMCFLRSSMPASLT